MKRVLGPFLAILIFVTGCAHIPKPILPKHIHSIYIPIFSNETLQYGLEDTLTNFLIEEFILDGRLNVVREEKNAEAKLKGRVITYAKEPIGYDETGLAVQYKIWVVIKVSLEDLVEKKEVWSDEFEGLTTYIPDFSRLAKQGVGTETEKEALWRCLKNLAKDVVKRTIVGW